MLNVAHDLPRQSERLVVAFGGLRHKLGGIRGEFYRSLERTECAAVFVRDFGCRWYQYQKTELEPVMAQIGEAKAKAGAQRLVCIGNSMGGFGALLFGSLLDADAVLSFVPQTAIEPSVTRQLGDERWADYQAQIPAYPYGDLVNEMPSKGRTILCWGAEDPLVHRLRRRGHREPNNVSSYQLHNPEHHESFDGV